MAFTLGPSGLAKCSRKTLNLEFHRAMRPGQCIAACPRRLNRKPTQGLPSCLPANKREIFGESETARADAVQGGYMLKLVGAVIEAVAISSCRRDPRCPRPSSTSRCTRSCSRGLFVSQAMARKLIDGSWEVASPLIVFQTGVTDLADDGRCR
jgi:hypothetical protein